MSVQASQSNGFSDAAIGRALAPFGAQLSGQQVAQVREYAQLLRKWNARVNLTSITTPWDILVRLFGESFFGAKFVPASAQTLADIGSGAGFPGLTLKIVLPRLQITLIEPALKKVAFLREAARVLQVEVNVVARRTEAGDTLECYDCITTRAVRVDQQLLEWARKALRAPGTFLNWNSAGEAAKIQKVSTFAWLPAEKIPGAAEGVILIGKKL